MKRALSILLASLLLASSLVSCGNSGNGSEKETTAETNSLETTAPNTEAHETASPDENTSYDTTKITENGVAKAHIVLPDGASAKEQTAAEELAYHIKLVSNADVTVANAVGADSLPIIIATPDSLPELEELFPEDLAWIRDTGEVGDKERWGSDGFAVKQLDGKIYIFGATPSGVLNGVYDFIEENLDLIWIRSGEEGIIYDEMPTIDIVKADYREKSPFEIRYTAYSDAPVYIRNKHNTTSRPYGNVHTALVLLHESPTFDPNETEYYETHSNGTPLTIASTRQLNYWSELTANTVADSVIAILDGYTEIDRPSYITVSQTDMGWVSGVYPEQTLPFEYAPGKFVSPDDPTYLSTVLFTFINRVARRVAEKYPDVTINTLAYEWSIKPPVCEIEDNVSVWFCQYHEDFTKDSFAETLTENESDVDLDVQEALYYEEWVEKHPNVLIYSYYFCHYIQGWYERPLWDRMSDDLRYYAEHGGVGVFTDGTVNDTWTTNFDWTTAYRSGYPADHPLHITHEDAYAMNILSYWLFFKLCWNPYEDVDALIAYFCDKVYGDASPYMQEYYRLLGDGWNVGGELIPLEFNAKINLIRDAQYYFDYFIGVETDNGVNIYAAIQESLTKAWEAADDRAKKFIRPAYEAFTDWERFIQ